MKGFDEFDPKQTHSDDELPDDLKEAIEMLLKMNWFLRLYCFSLVPGVIFSRLTYRRSFDAPYGFTDLVFDHVVSFYFWQMLGIYVCSLN